MAHDHTHQKHSYGKAFAIGIGLNVAYVGVEAFYGFAVNSSALLAYPAGQCRLHNRGRRPAF